MNTVTVQHHTLRVNLEMIFPATLDWWHKHTAFSNNLLDDIDKTKHKLQPTTTQKPIQTRQEKLTNTRYARNSRVCMKTCFCHPTVVWRPLTEERLAISMQSIRHWKVH